MVYTLAINTRNDGNIERVNDGASDAMMSNK